MALYPSNVTTEVHIDASKVELGGIPLQKERDVMLRPVMYFSRVTTPAEQLYRSYDLKTLAAVKAIRFRISLVGVPFKVITDCTALRAIFEKGDIVSGVGLVYRI